MKHWLLKIENLLLLLPIILIGISELSIIQLVYQSPSEVSKQILRPALVMILSELFCWMLLMLIPYLLYYVLRKKKLFQPKVAWIHIGLSVLTLLLNLLQFDYTTSVSPGWHTTIYPFGVMGIIGINSILFLLVQVGFVTYFVRKIIGDNLESKAS